MSSSTASKQSRSSFALLTSLAYHPPPAASNFPLLDRHLQRLKKAHDDLAKELPDLWCSRIPLPSYAVIVAELVRCVEAWSTTVPQRIRLTIEDDGEPKAVSAPLTPMPAYPVRLVLDTQPTDYRPAYWRYKTTYRDEHDAARARHGADLHPSDDVEAAPFDVILYNDNGLITETTISNIALCLNPAVSAQLITPRESAGLLTGVQRAELLAKGEIVEGDVKLEDVKEAVKASRGLSSSHHHY